MKRLDLPEVEILRLYREEKFSMQKIANIYNVSQSAIHHLLQRLNITRRTTQETSRKYFVNENYFEKINTPEKSQILGMIYADGCLQAKTKNSKQISINLLFPDEDYLQFIKQELNYTGKIFESKNNYDNKIAILTISSVKIFDDLFLLGLEPRKSLTCDFPNLNQVPENLISHFIRGYMEGDGSVIAGYSKKKGRGRFLSGCVSFCGTIQFLEKMKEIIKEKLDINCVIYQKKQLKERNVNSHNLSISGNIQVLKFLQWIYSGYGETFYFVMPRKYKKYIELKENWEYKESIKEELKAEFRQKMSNMTKGRVVSPETREKCKRGNLEYSKLHRYKEIWIINDKGEIYNVRGIKYFCLEFDLPYNFFTAAINPNNKICQSCHGWKRYEYNPENPPENFIKKFY